MEMDEVVEWISTEERVPEQGRVVAVIYAPSSVAQFVRIARRLEDDFGAFWRLQADRGGLVQRQEVIVAWCPLPPMPKGS